MSKPIWIPQENENGFFHSDGRTWQQNNSEFDSIIKGDKKMVWLNYEISMN